MTRPRTATLFASLLVPILCVGCFGSSGGDGGDGSSSSDDGFFDDFSVDSLRFTVDRRPDERSTRSYDVRTDRVVMSVSATSEEDQGQADLDAWGRSDSITARVSLDAAELSPGDDSRTLVRIAGIFWNDRADGGTEGRAGDVYVQLRLRAFGDGAREASICVDRDLEDGSEEVPLFDGDHCDRVPDFEPAFGTPYTLTISVDREAGTLTYAVDERTRTVPVGEPMFLPANDRRGVQVTQEGTPGRSVGSVYAIGTDDYFQDFATEPPVIGPYRPLFDLESTDRTLSVIDGRARFEVAADVGENESLSAPVLVDSERVEAVLELSSASTLGGDAGGDVVPRVAVSLGGALYNDTAEGGFNDNEGNVFAQAMIEAEREGVPTIRYCLARSDTADFSASTALLAIGDENCPAFDIDAAFDTPYPVSIRLDREAGFVRFAVGEVERTHTIATPIFRPEIDRRFLRVQARAENGSTAVAFMDDFGTSSSAPRVSGR